MEEIYEKYITTHTGKWHPLDKKEYEMFFRYFKINYGPFLPKNKDAYVADFGCGPGHFLYFLKKMGYENSVGIDISEECVEFCKKMGFRVEKGDILEFVKDEKNKERFDLIVMNDTLEHIKKEDIIPLLKGARACLKEKGKIIIKVPNASNPFLGSNSRYIDFSHSILFTEESLSQVLDVAGFKNVIIKPQFIYIFYWNPINYLALISSKILNFLFRLIFLLYGNDTTRIFTKSIIGIAEK
jgi:SAM-dependent methyltransferase